MQRDAHAPARNRLAQESSPYLLQHAANPVDWYPWGSEALNAARLQNKPILLSIGYSACHWCHVMAHESFEDEATAALMNRLFVNIKVDREERPDLDKIYQLSHQFLTQRGGGWPLTMFLTPDDQQPFFGGTYFPKEERYGMPAFGSLLPRVAEYYQTERAAITQQNSRLAEVFTQILPEPAPAGAVLTPQPLAAARHALEEDFDKRFGGFGPAPKFPHPTSIERLLRHWHRSATTDTPDLQALYMATLTLTRMAEGGLFDQLGGGFSRYSVDDFWMIPHFEKMLYDNGALLAVYAQTAAATGDDFYADIASETAAWALRDMRAPSGGFYAALDADSEGHEGKFYVWQQAEVRAALTAEEYAVFAPRFGLDRTANFEGSWHLHIYASVADLSQKMGRSPAEITQLLDTARAKLLALRQPRIWPGRDDKILTAWNALLIRGLAIAARHLGRRNLAEAAEQAADFLRENLWRDGQLFASFKDGAARFPAYLDDYAYLADALLELLQTHWRAADLQFLTELLDALLERFWDDTSGGFFFTARNHELLIHRSKSFSDDAIPSGNGIAARVLGRAGFLLGEARYLEAAEQTLRAAWPSLERHPQSHMSMLNALDDYLHPVEIVIVRGPAAEAEAWRREVSSIYAPQRLCFAIPADAPDLPPALATKRAGAGTIAYLCKGMTCSEPIMSLPDLARVL
jgi:uncharacterized protein